MERKVRGSDNELNESVNGTVERHAQSVSLLENSERCLVNLLAEKKHPVILATKYFR